MKKFIKNVDDVLIFLGLMVIIYATYRMSWIAALYLSGISLIILGFLIGIGQKGSKS